MRSRAMWCAVVVSSLPSFAFAADAPKETGPTSRYAEERRFNELSDQKTALQKELDELKKQLDLIQGAQKEIASLNANATALDTAVGNLQHTFHALDSLPPTETLTFSHPVVAAFLNARNEFWGQTIGLLLKPMERVRSVPKFGESQSSFIDAIKALEPVDKLNVNENTVGVGWTGNLAGMFAPYSPPAKKSAMDQSLWSNVRGEVTSLRTSDVAGRIEKVKQDYTAYLNNLATRFKTEVDSRQAKVAEIDKQIGEVDQSLQEKKDQQGALDRSLVWAVYGMIGALTLLFLSLKFFNSDVAGKVVENRSLVEVMSMAFMLLTIIILGTGNKIGQETLGTLLGTIAGYIFGKKMSEANHVTPQPQPQPEPEPKKKSEPPPVAEPETAPA